MMIDVKDRIPTYPGRVKLVPVPGQPDTYDMVRADEPIEIGTPINRVLFESIRSDLSALTQNVANLIMDHASIAEIGSLPSGAEFGVYENNILVPYIKVSGDYNGTGRSAVIRKHIYKLDYLSTGTQGTQYSGGYGDTWLNTEFLNLLESRLQDAISEVSILCTKGNGLNTPETIERKVFLPSMSELGVSDSKYNVEGVTFPYFSVGTRRKALFNGAGQDYWTRTPDKTLTNFMGIIQTSGYFSNGNPTTSQRGFRPVFTLPHDYEVSLSAANTANATASTEVI